MKTRELILLLSEEDQEAEVVILVPNKEKKYSWNGYRLSKTEELHKCAGWDFDIEEGWKTVGVHIETELEKEARKKEHEEKSRGHIRTVPKETA